MIKEDYQENLLRRKDQGGDCQTIYVTESALTVQIELVLKRGSVEDTSDIIALRAEGIVTV